MLYYTVIKKIFTSVSHHMITTKNSLLYVMTLVCSGLSKLEINRPAMTQIAAQKESVVLILFVSLLCWFYLLVWCVEIRCGLFIHCPCLYTGFILKRLREKINASLEARTYTTLHRRCQRRKCRKSWLNLAQSKRFAAYRFRRGEWRNASPWT